MIIIYNYGILSYIIREILLLYMGIIIILGNYDILWELLYIMGNIRELL